MRIASARKSLVLRKGMAYLQSIGEETSKMSRVYQIGEDLLEGGEAAAELMEIAVAKLLKRGGT